ncbi:hypothetical protein LCGC14_0311260 [marine sediment metagenome]|uniref:PEP-utilising enzyme mobile domain-containing protein n=1 Tax=marine sediment metagenome TaxID=412755 RepID=A0A0F9WTZ7_9ZZZZ
MPVSNKLIGRAASPGIVQGEAFVVELPKTKGFPSNGAVLVSHMTTPDLLPAMLKSTAIVTQVGGITCHAAIVAREFSIPCVVGVRKLLDRVKTGTRLIVDGSKGTVEIVEIVESS